MYASIKNGSGVFRAVYEKGPVNEKNRKNKNPYSNYNRLAITPRFARLKLLVDDLLTFCRCHKFRASRGTYISPRFALLMRGIMTELVNDNMVIVKDLTVRPSDNCFSILC